MNIFVCACKLWNALLDTGNAISFLCVCFLSKLQILPFSFSSLKQSGWMNTMLMVSGLIWRVHSVEILMEILLVLLLLFGYILCFGINEWNYVSILHIITINQANNEMFHVPCSIIDGWCIINIFDITFFFVSAL